jgi:hypothetical protein
MGTTRNVALVLAGLLLGCGAGAAATRHAVAQAPAAPAGAYTSQASPAPTGPTWQQYCEDLRPTPQELNQLLAQRGAEGWELAAMPVTWTGQGFTGGICFKRPVATGRYAPSTL